MINCLKPLHVLKVFDNACTLSNLYDRLMKAVDEIGKENLNRLITVGREEITTNNDDCFRRNIFSSPIFGENSNCFEINSSISTLSLSANTFENNSSFKPSSNNTHSLKEKMSWWDLKVENILIESLEIAERFLSTKENQLKLRPKKCDYTTKITLKKNSFYDIKYKEQLNLATSKYKRSVEKRKIHHGDHNDSPAQSIREIVIKITLAYLRMLNKITKTPFSRYVMNGLEDK